jgi:hypothetical protein
MTFYLANSGKYFRISLPKKYNEVLKTMDQIDALMNM